MCAAKVAAHRSEEVGTALKTHIDQGKSVLFVTLTVRHHQGQKLSEVWSVVSKAWSAVHRTGSWRGTKRSIGDVQRYGVRGWVRAVEVTHGESGWHVHAHVAVLLNRELSEQERNEFGASMFDRWERACVRAGFEAPIKEKGFDIRPVVPGKRAGQAIGLYLAKAGLQSVGAEIGAGSSKEAKGSNRTPFQVLKDIQDSNEESAEYERDLQIWREWESGSHGRRQVSWSRGLRDELALDEEKTDEEIADEEHDGYIVGAIPSEHWPEARRDIKMRCALFRAVENEDEPEKAAQAVRVVLGAYGYSAVDLEVKKIEKKPPPGDEDQRRNGWHPAKELLTV
ncbi:protein rep [Corynebacterium camporealensis]